MLRSTLKNLFPNSEELQNTLNNVGIKETARAEELSPTDFKNLANKINL